MKPDFAARFWRWCGADFFSPKDFVRHSILILLVFAVIHAAGLREYTSVLNGTTGSLDMNPENAALLGCLYILVYLAAIILSPILMIAAGLLAIWQKIRTQKHLSRS